MNKWKTLNKEIAKSNPFLKLNDGESIEGVFRGDPYFFYSKFQDETNTEYKEWQPGLNFRFKVNFVTKIGDELISKVFNSGKTVASRIKYLLEEYGEDCLFKILRQSESKKVFYHIDFKSNLTPEQIDRVNSTPLNKLVAENSNDNFPSLQDEVDESSIIDINYDLDDRGQPIPF